MNRCQDIELFKSLDESVLEEIAKKIVTKKYKRENILFYEGETPSSLIFLLSGTLKLYKSDNRLNAVVLKRFKPYSSIAEVAVLENLPFPATAEFESDAEVAFLDLESFKTLITKEPEIAFSMMRSLSNKVMNLENLISLNLVLDSTSRVAKYIVTNEAEFKNIKKNVLAHDLNMTPETLSRVIKKFKTMKLLSDEKNSFEVLNREGLQAIYE